MDNNKKVAIFIPLYRTFLEEHEKISFRFLIKHLKKYDKFLVVPNSFNEEKCSFDISKFKIKRFPDKFFTSIKSYNDLLYTIQFYKQFEEYEYILSYQPDCLVFKDELEYFCSLGYDYIGAPWIKNSLKKVKNINKIKVGNGGFSLKNVDSCIKTLEEYQKSKNKFKWQIKYFLNNFLGDFKNIFLNIFLKKEKFKDLFRINEDIFWGEGVGMFNPKFQVAPPEVAISFSFENNVALCYKLNNNKLPLGCHAFQCERNLKEWKNLEVFNEKNKTFKIENIKYPEPVLKLKKAFENFEYCGINLWHSLAPESYIYVFDKKSEGNLLIRIFKILRCLFFIDRLNIINGGEGKILASFNLPRKDHHVLFNEILKGFNKNELMFIDNYFLKIKEYKKKLKIKPIITRSLFNFPNLKLLYEIWKHFKKNSLEKIVGDRFLFFIAQTYFKCKQIKISKRIIEEYNPKAYISSMPSLGDEAIFTQLFQKNEKPTFSLEHGLFIKETELQNLRFVNRFADYLLLWGEESYNFVKRYIDKKKLIIVGNPKCDKIIISKNKKFNPKNATVFLCGNVEEGNFKLIEIINRFSKKYPSILFKFKAHPLTPNKILESYTKKLDKFGSKLKDKNEDSEESLKESDFVIIYDSTVYIEALKYQIPIFRFGEAYSKISSVKDKFKSFYEFEKNFLDMFKTKNYKTRLKEYSKLYKKHSYQPRGCSIPEHYKKVINKRIKEYYSKKHSW